MPDYQVKEWNETNSLLDSPYSQTAYANQLWSKLSNLVRLQALHAEGGIYLDTDVELIKDFSPLLHDKCFVGFQQEEEHVDWVNNAILGARPGHHFLQRCMDMTIKWFEDEGEFCRSPMVTTAVLKGLGLGAYGLQEVSEVIVYPVEYFYPYPWFGKFAPDCIRENTYCVHYWEGTWRKKEHSIVLPPLRTMKRIVRTLVSRCH
jgi:mannosyltransferase OCH1-like enzyme